MIVNGNLVEAVSDSEKLSELNEREGRMERTLRNAWYEFGLDLKAVRDKELYKVSRSEPVAGRYSFSTFEEYIEGKWERNRDWGYKKIESATVAENVLNKIHLSPSSESHVRELLKLETDDDRATVWQKVVDRDETVTAKIVNEEVQKYLAAKEKNWYTVDEWNELHEDVRRSLRSEPESFGRTTATFNKQDGNSIEWAQWSWNPITGCKHDCPYCYARDIANRFYPQKFEPSVYPERFLAPGNTKVPATAEGDVAFKNVFTCSMADLFGRWVPLEWIEWVMEVVADNAQWNFLFLTKFPQRFAELGELPPNAWMGTTVDCQSRVKNAEKAFSKVKGGTKWLSVEPMLTPIKFDKLELFNWVVIGGSSPSAKTPAWVPPFDWVADLHAQARKAGCTVYHKDNLKMNDDAFRLREFPWEENESRVLPDALKYLDIA